MVVVILFTKLEDAGISVSCSRVERGVWKSPASLGLSPTDVEQ